MSDTKSNSNPVLRRSLSLPLVCLYGLGNILGAGVYVLVGKVAGEAGYLAPVAFLLASVIAGVTAFTFAELSSRYPLSAGEAVYVQQGIGIKNLSFAVGLLIILTGIVSAATIANGFTGYLAVFIELPDWLVIIGLLFSLCLIAIWGIAESVSAAALFTLLEVGGLILILYVVAPAFVDLPLRQFDFIPDTNTDTWPGIFSGAFLAFYAFIGFEDMVNVAEEVKNPRRNMPLAILFAVLFATVLYIAIAICALLVLTPAELNQSDAPLASVYERATNSNPWVISVVSLFAVVNGALIQIIMASRVCYGLSNQNWLPEFFGKVSTKTHTPINATVIIAIAIIVAALWFPMVTLANATTYLLLVVFSLVNFSLIRIKQRGGSAENIFEVPIAVPVTGLVTCVAFLLFQTASLLF
jgi:amino acid transporter